MKALQAFVLLVVICFMLPNCKKDEIQSSNAFTATTDASDGQKSIRFTPTSGFDSADLNIDILVSISDHDILKIHSGEIVVLNGSKRITGKSKISESEIRFTPDHELSPLTTYKVHATLTLKTGPNDSRQLSVNGRSVSDSKNDIEVQVFSWKFNTRSNYRYSMNRTSRWVTDFNRDGNKIVQMGEYLYTYGGWTAEPLQSYNDVYRSSGDLTQWERLADAPWEGRHTYGIGKIDSTLFIFGGDNLSSLFDVWKSNDGVNFTPVSQDLESVLGPRLLYGACIHNSKLYILGGQSGLGEDSALTDVWLSGNGGLWRRIANNLPFLGKNISGSVVSFNNKIWVIGGGYYRSSDLTQRYTNQVFSSTDGINWEQEPDAPWNARQYGDVVVWNNRLWIIAGYNEENLSDIWYMNSVGEWQQFETSEQFEPRHASGVGVYNDKLVIVCGNYHNDCWVIEKI